jgi:hypothetical protein
MPHGKHVPFDAHTDDQHKCTKTDTKKVSKKKIKDKEITTTTQPRKVSETVDNYVAEDNNIINNNTNEETFQNDTLESLKSEIEVEVKESKNNNKLIFIAAAVVIILLIYFNS